MSAGQIWSRYVRYIGAGAVAAAGIVTVAAGPADDVRSPWPPSCAGCAARGPGRTDGGAVPRTDRDLPGWVVLAGPVARGPDAGRRPGPPRRQHELRAAPRRRARASRSSASLFVVVSSRIVGLIGVSSNPTSGMTLVTLLGVAVVFVLFGWNDPSARAAILTVGTVVCIAASKAGDISQDLKTGYLVGATPARSRPASSSARPSPAGRSRPRCCSSARPTPSARPSFPRPQATLMKTVIDGVLAGSLPWGLVGTGAAFSLCAMLAGLPGPGLRRRHLPAARRA